ncbi:MAG TPA: DUF2332 domain-containing protein [Ilumatobacter sp.]|nr:DUF2332 domain-containing protein [Ilumatobacter sp.]
MFENPSLADSFAQFADEFSHALPMYSDLALGIAADRELLALLQHAPAEQQLPVLLFASVHALVLDEPSLRLAAYYPSMTDEPRTDSAFTAFRALCLERRADIEAMVSNRTVQTNEVGRCRFYLPTMAIIGREMGHLSLVDVGTSAGLNLLFDRFRYSFSGPDGEFDVGSESGVHLRGEFRGAGAPAPLTMPQVSGRLGFDRSPVDLTDPADRTWLRACVWPEQLERFQRLDAAIDLALAEPIEVRRGDAVDELAAAVASASTVGHPVVMNSWVLNYLTSDRRAAYVTEMDRLGSEVDLSWVFAESPRMCDHLPFPVEPRWPNLTLSMLVTWRDGVRTVRHLADCHPHGEWLHWVDQPVP